MMPPRTRRDWLVLLLGAPVALGLNADPLQVRVDGDFVRITAPHLNFLSGKTLDRLHDGSSVAFIGQLSLALQPDAPIQSRSLARFAVSYDIWEEKFSVTRIQQVRHTISHLSLEAAEGWLIDDLTLNTSALPQDRPFWVRFELRAEDPRDGLDIVGEPGINLTRLVEIFSRPPHSAQARWALTAGPLRLADLRPRQSRIE